MGGRNTIVMHNTCEDSLLATPLIYDLVILAELCQRIKAKKDTQDDWEGFHPVLSLLSYMLKAPLVPNGAPVINALFAQRCAIVNVMRACLGLPPDNHMTLEHRFESSLQELQGFQPATKRPRTNGMNGDHGMNGNHGINGIHGLNSIQGMNGSNGINGH